MAGKENENLESLFNNCMHTKDNGHHNTGHGFLAGLVTLLKKFINIINSHLYCFDKSSLKTLFLVEDNLEGESLAF